MVRSLVAGTGIGLSTVNNALTITPNQQALTGGLQDALIPILTNTPIMNSITIRALQAGANVSLKRWTI